VICRNCARDLEDTRFSLDRRSRSGRRSLCKDCVAVEERARRERDPAAWRERNRQQYASNPGPIIARQVARRDNLVHAEHQARVRARRRGVRIDQVDYRSVVESHGPTCGICAGHVAPQDLTIDHVIPLAAHGPHAGENLQVAHRSCNSRKGARLPS
jgi:5-methylcytosine-specific restriction endonuclease McrA